MAITFVSATSGAGVGVGTITCAPATHTAGNLLYVFVRANDYSPDFWLSVEDDAGNTYTQIGADLQNTIAGADTVAQFYAKNIIGQVANVVYVNAASGEAFGRATVLEFSGCDVNDPLDTTANAITGSTSSLTSGLFTTAQADEVIVSGMSVAALSGAYTPGSMGGVTGTIPSGATQDGELISAQYAIVSSVITNGTAAVSWSVSSRAEMMVATFKAAASATTYNENVSFSLSQGVSQSGQAQISAALTLGVSQGLAASGVVEANASASFGLVNNAIAITDNQVLNEVITLAVQLGVLPIGNAQVNASVTFNQLLATDHAATLNALATVGYAVGMNLAANVAVNVNDTVSLGILARLISNILGENLRVRTFLVPVILRLLSVQVHSRLFVVPEDADSMMQSTKDPLAIEVFTFDFEAQLQDAIISAVDWSIDSEDVTLSNASFTDTTASVKLTGGTLRTEYLLTCDVTLSDEQHVVRRMALRTVYE